MIIRLDNILNIKYKTCMYDHKNYTPILRWKAAEKTAIDKLTQKAKQNIIPLVEFLMPQVKNLDQDKTPKDLLNESIKQFNYKLSEIPKQIEAYWGKDPVFIDVQLIDGSIRAKTIKKLLVDCQSLNIAIIPVINLMTDNTTSADIDTNQVSVDFAQKNSGLCIRISKSNLDSGTLQSDIDNFININRLDKRNVDFLVDFKIINDEISSNYIIDKMKTIPYVKEWRRFIFSGGSFPKDLSMFEKHNQYNIPRKDWLIWKDLITKLERAPSFSDYTIQHPLYAPAKIQIINPSASIRYTLEDNWLVIRGEGLRNPKGAGFKQYPALASLLVRQKEFKGENFSFGDKYISEKAADINTKNTGNPKTWLQAGINHHMSLVATQIAKLS